MGIIDDMIDSRAKKDLEELEKLAGFSPSKNKRNKFDDIAGKVSKKRHEKKSGEHERYWLIHKEFANVGEKYGRSFCMFVGDTLDIILSVPRQEKILSFVIDDKVSRLKKTKEGSFESIAKHIKRAFEGPTHGDYKVGGEERVAYPSFIKRKVFLGTIFTRSDEYKTYLKFIKDIEQVCKTEASTPPPSEDERKKALEAIIEELRYEIRRQDLINAWAILNADNFKNLEWFFMQAKGINIVRPDYYDDLNKIYRIGKKMLKLLLKDVQTSFPPSKEKEEAYENYLKSISEIYMYHHFVLKRHHQTTPIVTLKDFELTKEDAQEKITSQREENDSLRAQIADLTAERDRALAKARTLKNTNEELKQKLSKLDPAEVKKQLYAAEAKTNAAKKELRETLEEDAELRSDMRKLDAENQELTRRLQQLNALPDEEAYSIEGLMQGKRVVIFGGIGRDHYWPTLKEAGVKNEDYEWYEGYHTINLARTAEIVGRCDLAVVVTSYAGHLLLYQVRPCIQPHQHFFKIHNSGAGTLRKEILAAFKKNKA